MFMVSDCQQFQDLSINGVSMQQLNFGLVVRLLLDDPDDPALDVFRTDPENLFHLEDDEVADLVNGDDWDLVDVKFA